MPKVKKNHTDDASWIRGFATALAELHRRQCNSSSVCEVARDAGVTIALCRKLDILPFDWRELKRAGVP